MTLQVTWEPEAPALEALKRLRFDFGWCFGTSEREGWLLAYPGDGARKSVQVSPANMAGKVCVVVTRW